MHFTWKEVAKDMTFILCSLIFVQTVLIFVKTTTEKKRVIVCGVGTIILLGVAGSMNKDIIMWVCFFISHCLLMIVYLLVNYGEIECHYKRIDAKEFVSECLEIPTCFYLIPILFLVVGLMALETTSEGFIPIVSTLSLSIIAMLYNYITNISIKRRMKNNTQPIENELMMIFYKKCANLLIFLVIESIAVGMFYSSIFVELSEKRVALLFVMDLFINFIAYGIYYYRLKKIGTNFIAEIENVYPRWQLFVPKKVGVGYSLNSNCPITYLLVSVVVIGIMVFLLCP